MLRQRAALRPRHLQNLEREIQRLTADHPELLGALYKEGSLFFIVAEKRAAKVILRDTVLFNISFFTPRAFQKAVVDDPSLLGASILFGYERLLLLLSGVQHQLLNAGFATGAKTNREVGCKVTAPQSTKLTAPQSTKRLPKRLTKRLTKRSTRGGGRR